MTSPPFSSFFMGGFECADHINRSGERVNLLAATEHDLRVREDYALLAKIGIRTVREGICWSQVEKAPYVFDFGEVVNRLKAGEEQGIQQIWDLCHFGYPDGLIPTHPQFVPRFAALCEQFIRCLRERSDKTVFIVPINEISFLSWHSGDVRGTVPFAVHSGFDMKYHLCKAAIEGIKTLRRIDPSCRILTVEPLVKIHHEDPFVCEEENKALNESQFQAMDILGGWMCPELGGMPEHLDILGFNYYYNNQWYHHQGHLPWPEEEIKRIPLSSLLQEVYQRYERPIVLTETGHFGEKRVQWLQEVSREAFLAISKGVDLRGICLYPITDRPDWDDLFSYSRCGLYDLDEHNNRLQDSAYLNQLKECILLYEALLQHGLLESRRHASFLSHARLYPNLEN